MKAVDRTESVGTGWEHWFARGWQAFFAIASTISLANLAAHNGIEWRAYIRDVVQWYREIFVPLRDLILTPVLAPLFALFRWRLDSMWLDAATVLILGFGAANAESVTRHRRPLVLQLFVMSREANEWLDTDERLLGLDARSFLMGLGALGIVTIPIVLIRLLGELGNSPYLSTWQECTLAWWGLLGFFGVLYSIFMLVAVDAAHGAGRDVVLQVVRAPLVPFAAISALLISPLLAWRTSTVCVSLFLALLVLNLLIPT